MKKLVLLTTVLLLFSVLNAQTSKETPKNDNKSKKQEESAIKKEKREERKELRKQEGKVVGDKSKQSFIRDFGNIPSVKWERTINFDEALFSKNGKELTAYYDVDANLVGTTSNVTFNDLPAKAQKEIKDKYKEYSKSVIFFDDNEANESDMLLYGVQCDDIDSYFIEVQKDNKRTILKVNPAGYVYYFTTLTDKK